MMTPKKWTLNLNNSIGTISNHKVIKQVFSAIIDLTVMNDWKGACHESCGVIHILLNEAGVQNTWCIGEAKVGQALFDHSWIEINSEVYDISICRPLQPAFKSGPVIKGIDIDINQRTAAMYGVISGQPDDQMTTLVKSLDLTDYLLNSPVHPTLGTWMLVEHVAKNILNRSFNMTALMAKYQGQFFAIRP